MGALAGKIMGSGTKATSKAVPAQAAPPPQKKASGFNDAKPRGMRNYLLPIDDFTSATYVVEVKSLQLIFRNESKSPQPCESSIINLEVIESNNPKCPPGFMGSVVYTDKFFQDIYWGNVKAFLCALLNKAPEEVTEEMWHSAFGRRPAGVSDTEWEATQEEVSKLVLGAKVNVSVKYKLREGKPPITQEAWTTNPEQHPDA